MKFTVHSRDGKQMFVTEYEEYIPFDALESIQKAGYHFKIDNKPVTIKYILALFNKPITRVDTDSDILQIDIEEVIKSVKFPITTRTIICMNTGKLYKNQAEASKELNIDPGLISYAITNNKPCKGLIFKKVVGLK